VIPPAIEAVTRVLADVLGVDPRQIRPDSSPDTIEGWDSVQHLNLIIAVEQEFGVRFAPAEIEDAVTIKAIAELIERKQRREE